jgi:hypothetical protein
MVIARQNTARTVTVGPVLDADGAAVTDGVVGDFKLAKNGGAPAALDGSATLTHRHTGFYSLALTANDLDTVGQAEVVIDDTTNACPVKELTVVEEAVYDALFAASAAGYSTLTAGNVNAEVDTALADYDAPTKAELDAGLAGLNDLDSTAVQTAAAAALTAYDPPTKAEVDAGFAALNDLSAADVNAEVDAALADIHLDHLLATDYDPASKPGTATALLNELVGNDGGVSQFTSNALELAPTGGSAPTADAIADEVETRTLLANVTQWAGSAVATPTNAGVPEVDLTHVGGVAAAPGTPDVNVASVDDGVLTAAKFSGVFPANFASLGINASGHVSRVTLVDTTTANTDMRGTDDALLAASYTAPLDAAGVRGAVGLAAADLDDQLDAMPTATENADALLDRADGVESGLTFREWLRLGGSVLFGKSTNGNKTFRDLADTKDRVAATVNASGERTAVTRDAS